MGVTCWESLQPPPRGLENLWAGGLVHPCCILRLLTSSEVFFPYLSFVMIGYVMINRWSDWPSFAIQKPVGNEGAEREEIGVQKGDQSSLLLIDLPLPVSTFLSLPFFMKFDPRLPSLVQISRLIIRGKRNLSSMAATSLRRSHGAAGIIHLEFAVAAL